MSVTYPIKNKKALEQFKDYYVSIKPNPRNYTMIVMGLNTAFRIGDLLQLQWNDVYDDKRREFRKHICITEQKTGKERIVAVNQNEQTALTQYYKMCGPSAQTDYLFRSRKQKGAPLSRYQAYRIIKEAARNTGFEEHIGWLPLSQKNIRLPCVEAGHAAGHADGTLQPFFLSGHTAISRYRTG